MRRVSHIEREDRKARRVAVLTAAGLLLTVALSQLWTPTTSARIQPSNSDPLAAETAAPEVWQQTERLIEPIRHARSVVRSGSLPLLKETIAQGVDMEADLGRGQTMLMIASEAGNDALVRYLIASHAGVRAVDREGNSSLSLAAENGHAAVVDLLLKSHAIPSIDASIGRAHVSLLTMAVAHRYVDLTRYLVLHHADVNARDRFGNSALDVATSTGQNETVRFLVRHHAKLRLNEAAANELADRVTDAGPRSRIGQLQVAAEIIAILKGAGAKS